MTAAFPSLPARVSSASFIGAALILVALSTPARGQILYDTTTYAGGAPGSTAAAIATFDSLAASTSGYGCSTVATLDGVQNQTQSSSGSDMNIAFHEAAIFVVAPSQAGLWSFRWAPDFGWGGTLLLDGTELQALWTDLWWGGSFTDPTQYLAGSANLTAGTHIVEVFGFENCCGGQGNAQFLPPLSSTWQDISAANLTLVPAVCGSPSLLLTGSASPSPVLDGSQLTFTFFYESTGESSAASALLSASIPDNTTFVSASGGVFGSGAVNWDLGSLGVGVSGTVSLTVQVNAPLPDGTPLSDLASLSATGATTATATTKVTVSNSILTLGAASAPNPVMAGASLTISLAYANSGTGAGAMATLVDMLPPNTTFVSASNGGTYDATSNQVSWNLGSLAMGASGSVSYVVRVATPLADGTVLSDMATLSASNNAPVTATSMTMVGSPIPPPPDAGPDGGAGGNATGAGGAAGGPSPGAGGAAGGPSPDAGGAAGGSAIGSGGGGGSKGAAGSGAGGKQGAAGTPGASNASSGCDCAVGTAPSPTSILGFGALVGLLVAGRRKRRR